MNVTDGIIKSDQTASSSSINEFGESDQIYVYTVWVTTIQQILSIFGIVFNSALVYITIKHKSLHRSYGYLLGICSLCDALTEAGTPLATVLVFLRLRISLLTCFYAQFFAPVALLNSTMNLLWISVDRIAAMAFPVLYRNISRSSGKFVIIANAISFSIIFYIVCLSYIFALQHPDMMVYCEPGDSFQGNSYFFAAFLMMVSTLVTVVLYIIMWIMLKVKRSDQNGTSKNSTQSQLEITRRIFKSLAMIMTVIFCFWFMAGLITFMGVPQLITSDPSMQFLINRLVAQLATIAGAINAPVLYICSTEYRQIMKHEFQCVKLLCPVRIQISFTQPKPQNNNVVFVTRTHQHEQENSNKITINQVHIK